MIGEDEADAMRRVAFAAALAVAVRPALGEEAFAELHAPFGHSELQPLRLGARERRQIEAFLRTLSGPLVAPR